MLVAVSLSVVAQQSTEMVSFAGETPVGNLDKDEVFKRMLVWHQQNMPKDALREINEAKSELKGTSFLRYTSNVSAAGNLTQGYILYDFKVVAVENGFRFILTNFRHDAKIKFHTLTTYPNFPYKISTVEKPWYDLVWKDLKLQLNQQVPKMLATLTESIKNETYAAHLQQKTPDAILSRLIQSSSNE